MHILIKRSNFHKKHKFWNKIWHSSFFEKVADNPRSVKPYDDVISVCFYWMKILVTVTSVVKISKHVDCTPCVNFWWRCCFVRQWIASFLMLRFWIHVWFWWFLRGWRRRKLSHIFMKLERLRRSKSYVTSLLIASLSLSFKDSLTWNLKIS